MKNEIQRAQRQYKMLNSPVDIALIGGVLLLLFGPKKLPEIGKALGQGIGNFKKSLTEAQDEVKSAIKNSEAETPPKPIANPESSDKIVKDA